MHRHRTAIGGIGLVLSGVGLGLSYREPSQAQDDEHAIKSWSFGASVVGVTGEVADGSGRLLEKTEWATHANLMVRRLSFGRWQSVARLTSGMGKLLGGVGGVLAGIVQGWQGVDALKRGDTVFGWASLSLGVATGALAATFALTTFISGGLALVLTLLLIAAGFVISLFKHDELQHWLDSCYFGLHKLSEERYANFEAQKDAYTTLIRNV